MEERSEQDFLEAHNRALATAGSAIEELNGDSLEVLMTISSLVLWLTTESPNSKRMSLDNVLDMVRHSVVSGGDRRTH